ncbi:MAG: ROK family protein [Dehalococcoidia bacterium]|nr:ROK family protein [Dehalococcoidia bacterium]
MNRTVLAADFGGTHLRAAVVDEAGGILQRSDHATPANTPQNVAATVVDLLAEVARAASPQPSAVCIATAGLINADQGKVILAPNIPGFRNLVLTTPVAERLGIPAFIENDASAAALGEFRFGAGRGTRHLLHATLGTGIGGGIVIDGRLYRGASGLAGEIGHIILNPAGPKCNCGSRGCLKQWSAVWHSRSGRRRSSNSASRRSSTKSSAMANRRRPTSTPPRPKATPSARPRSVTAAISSGSAWAAW